MCSGHDSGNNYSPSFSPKRGKNEMSGYFFLTVLVIGIFSLLYAISLIQDAYNFIATFLSSIF